jgi:hypothetical protein
MPRFELFPFRYRDRITCKWVRARYVATTAGIAARYAEWEITARRGFGTSIRMRILSVRGSDRRRALSFVIR